MGLEAGCQAGSLGFWESAGPVSGPGGGLCKHWSGPLRHSRAMGDCSCSPWCRPLFIPLPVLDPDRPDTVCYAWLHANLCHHNTKLLTQTHIIIHMQSHRGKNKVLLECMRDSLLFTLKPLVSNHGINVTTLVTLFNP